MSDKYPTAPDWRAIASRLYDAIGRLEDETPGGISFGHGKATQQAVQAAIDAYEYATDIKP